ncbi:DUF3034 family protein [Lacimicrobium alkaliphilum]|uniref:DUF3034 domain-containing protein n=1 Tax=Lacimicrobium alkaliphilum TaxID=1526571 RepID=A0ABQ1R5S7_9ALTE|nr:DUF3034 family protein [Lacimicrobium alkaliphilum]GGD58148.1 hypothetical protein GCM10011357_11890 [Lacimicrobium alkaliphilum]
MIKKLFFCLSLTSLSPLALATGSSLVATGGITSFEGTAGGGITPWAMIAGYGSKEEIHGTGALQQLDLGEYQLRTVGAAIGFYDRVELSVQRQNLKVESGIVSNVFNLLTDGAVNTAPGTDIEQDIIGLKVKVFGDAVFDQNSPWPQVSVGAQYKKNRDFDTSLPLSDGSVPLPDTGVPQLLGATEDAGTDFYVSASKLWLGGAWGNNVLANVTARMTKANTFGLLGFESAADDGYELEWEGSVALLPSPSTAVGIEWRTQTNRLGGLAEEKTVTDLFIAYFPNKHWSLTAAYVDLGNLPFDQKASGLYLSATVNL